MKEGIGSHSKRHLQQTNRANVSKSWTFTWPFTYQEWFYVQISHWRKLACECCHQCRSRPQWLSPQLPINCPLLLRTQDREDEQLKTTGAVDRPLPFKRDPDQRPTTDVSSSPTLTWTSAWYPLQVVWVPGNAMEMVVRLWPHAQLAGIGGAQWDGPRSLQQGQRWSVNRGDDAAPGAQTRGEGHACEMDITVAWNY